MEVQPDFKELLASFNANGVEYLIVGGYALAFHGAPGYTGAVRPQVRTFKETDICSRAFRRARSE
jgi:hypothetical protein